MELKSKWLTNMNLRVIISIKNNNNKSNNNFKLNETQLFGIKFKKYL